MPSSDGQFQPGESGNPNGSRGNPNAGDKRRGLKLELETILDYPNPFKADGTLMDPEDYAIVCGAEAIASFTGKAWATMFAALGNKDDEGNVTTVALRAAQWILNRKYGREPIVLRREDDNTPDLKSGLKMALTELMEEETRARAKQLEARPE